MKKSVVMAVAFIAAAMMSSSVYAAGPLRAVGVEAGYVSPDLNGVQDASGTWVAGVFLDFGLPATNLYINPFVNYWNWSDGSGSAETSFRDWTVGANLKFTIPAPGFQPFLAAGASAHLMNASVGSLEESDTKIGYQAGAGVKVGVSQSASIIGSGWWNAVENADNWSLRAGLVFGI
jgi:opacity protein-like surface antigen